MPRILCLADGVCLAVPRVSGIASDYVTPEIRDEAPLLSKALDPAIRE